MSTPFDKSLRPDFYVYTDGSFINHGSKKSGAGFVVTDIWGNVVHEGSLKLGNADSSSLAEIYAAVLALRSIENPSNILLHSDERTLCETIALNKFHQRIVCAGTRNMLKTAYEDLKKIVAFHFHVSASHKPRKSTLEMLKAHQLAQEGVDQPIQIIFVPQ